MTHEQGVAGAIPELQNSKGSELFASELAGGVPISASRPLTQRVVPSHGVAGDEGLIEIGGHHYVTASRLAEMLGITVRTLSRWNALRIGPPKIVIGKKVLFDLAKLPAWLATREMQPTRNAHSR